ncbi:phage terminase large subunit family protein [Stenotrophomonas terrae]|uniref:phage terminase large subunit family protein n=1 Tax=Stenotrophomonas terrae TaxID=405446 RepID=UPI0009FA76F7|nr:terminase gpA endonuclease subunit [Stenotrophomonas terrae]
MNAALAPSQYAEALTEIGRAIGRAIAPRKHMRVSEWATEHRVLSSKGSSSPGEWDNTRNPLLVEVMDCFSARSGVHDVVAQFPIQFGKSETETNILGYTMCENPMPIMVALPGEISANKWIDQKLNPMIESTKAVQHVLTSTNSRESSNRRSFKDFEGGQLYIEHAGNPVRLKSTSVGLLLADEFSSFASELRSGDDPDEMLDGRTSAFPSTYKRFKVGTPEIAGLCRVSELFDVSDQRRWHWPCPDCGHEQPFEWGGLQWTPDLKHCWYVCRECGVVIEEHQKTRLIAAGHWVAGNPGAATRGYHANCLYYPMGLGPRWLELAQRWVRAQGDMAKLKTFINDRLAEPWEDKSTAKAKPNLIKDRLEVYHLREAPIGVLAITAGVDTQDNRLAVTILGWGRGMVAWVLDYVELAGDPAELEVWVKLTDLLNRGIAHISGAILPVEATCIDAGGHRTEYVKHYCRQKLIRRPMCIFGAKPNNAPVLGRPKLEDVNYKGKLDKKGVTIYQVGTVNIKQWFFPRLGGDADRVPEARLIHLSEDLDDFYINGLVSEKFNPKTGRYEPIRGGVRNEPLDTFVYAYAAAHHQDLRLHRQSAADWDMRERRIIELAGDQWTRVSRETQHASPADDVSGNSVFRERSTTGSASKSMHETSVSRETLAEAVQPPAPVAMSVRAALDAIVCIVEREPAVVAMPEHIAAWSGAVGGTAEETYVLNELFLVIHSAEQGTPVARAVPASLHSRAVEVLRGKAQTQRPRRFVRGTRHHGQR